MPNMAGVGRMGNWTEEDRGVEGVCWDEAGGVCQNICKQNGSLHQVEALYTISLFSSLRTDTLVTSELLGKCW